MVFQRAKNKYIRRLLQDSGFEGSDLIFNDRVADLDWMAANFAIFDVSLAADGGIEDHRNLFPTVGAGEKMFHVNAAAVEVEMEKAADLQV